jgi:hypothetical protein
MAAEDTMSEARTSMVVAGLVLLLGVPAGAMAAPSEIKGAAILDHACGKTSVKHMGLVNAGKIEDAVKLGTAEMQEKWKALAADEKKMLSEMMKDLSSTEADFSSQIKAGGVLAVDGASATLSVKQEHKDASGTSTSTMTQRFQIDGASCKIAR